MMIIESQMCIVTGPNIDIAIKLIKRMKALFDPKLHVTFDSKETVLELNGCTIEAYLSNHIDAYRAMDNPKFILIDGDFFRKGEQEDVRHVSERYIAKSDPCIVMVSTPVSDKDIEEFLALGAKAILRKPLSIQELQDTIDKFR